MLAAGGAPGPTCARPRLHHPASCQSPPRARRPNRALHAPRPPRRPPSPLPRGSRPPTRVFRAAPASGRVPRCPRRPVYHCVSVRRWQPGEIRPGRGAPKSRLHALHAGQRQVLPDAQPLASRPRPERAAAAAPTRALYLLGSVAAALGAVRALAAPSSAA
ncbi:hypothetical protein B0H15DRAFT_809920 [Mycena belliarum]|uniref:Uncharacterized protein n=1 Tax=Mycena belliarum TaxID=1033014 RepID=A0AAD6XWT2_9AGAR|nr:hypothetical protein B0H15DRAFT_809920 [Mycena belliae]